MSFSSWKESRVKYRVSTRDSCVWVKTQLDFFKKHPRVKTRGYCPLINSCHRANLAKVFLRETFINSLKPKTSIDNLRKVGTAAFSWMFVTPSQNIANAQLLCVNHHSSRNRNKI
jgi:hypothetical protein